jgi:hypothetical protein
MSDTLRRALATPLPIELTTNEDAPVLYRIMYRDSETALEYNAVATDNMFNPESYSLNLISLASAANNSSLQAWYFVKGTDVGYYYICPLEAGGMVLGSNPNWQQVMQSGDGKVWVENRMAANRVVQWRMTEQGGGLFNIAPVGGSGLLLGRYSAASQYLGFVSTTSSTEALFGFEPYVESETAVEFVEDERCHEAVIYDLSGRVIRKITTPGLYIVNGKKVYLSPVNMK